MLLQLKPENGYDVFEKADVVRCICEFDDADVVVVVEPR